MNVTLKRALVLLLGGGVLVALVPAGIMLERRLGGDLERRAREDLVTAKMILMDRNAARAEVMKMHAMQFASSPRLERAIMSGAWDRALALLDEISSDDDEQPVLVGPGGGIEIGPELSDVELQRWGALVDVTRRGEAWVGMARGVSTPHAIAIAPVMVDSSWVGAVGVARAFDDDAAAALAGLTQTEVVIFDRAGRATAQTIDGDGIALLASFRRAAETEDGARELTLPDGRTFWGAEVPLEEVGTVLFARAESAELAILSSLRSNAIWAGAVALVAALLLGGFVAGRIAQPVSLLASASDRVAEGDFGTPLPTTRISDVQRMSTAFGAMRDALASRLAELREANAELEDRQERLSTLQSELVQRDRLTANNRLVTELAHEIRNPVANVRNCLEVLQRRVPQDSEAREFADLAIDELLRMHELAEKMLDVNRPEGTSDAACDPVRVAHRTAALYGARENERWPILVETSDAGKARIAPDALKQVLVNLIENSREAMPEGGEIRLRVRPGDETVFVEVADDGPGIPAEIEGNLFDPFFTTKGEVQGVGLGLYIARSTVRRFGGRLGLAESNGAGARFVIELLKVDEAA